MSEKPQPHVIIPAQPGWVTVIPWPTKDGLTLLRLPVIVWSVAPGRAAIPISPWGTPPNAESSFVMAPGRPELFDGAGRWWPNEAAFVAHLCALDAATVRTMAREGLASVYYPHGGPLGARQFYPADASGEGGRS